MTKQEQLLYDALIEMVQLVRGDDQTIYETWNPYARPAMKKALGVIASVQGKLDYFDASVPVQGGRENEF